MAEGLGLRCLVIAGASVVAMSVLLRAMWNLAGSSGGRAAGRDDRREFGFPARAVRRLTGESGTATVEFVLVFPVALFICLILLQTMLVFTGNLFVNYAAYAAVRSAIVQAPVGFEGGGGELIDGGPAHEAARRAAAFALTPVSGRLKDTGTGTVAGGGDPPTDGEDGQDREDTPVTRYVSGLKSYYDTSAPAWVDNLAGDRLAYALDADNTQLTLYETRVLDNGVPEFVETAPGEAVTFGPKDPVTVGVTHRLHLSIPYASFFFADKTEDANGRGAVVTHETLGGQTPYSTVFATCTMTLEGYDTALPPLPAVERED